MKLDKSFYLQEDVVLVAKELIGKKLVHLQGTTLREAMIVETEAYSYKEQGCHAYNKKLTKRTATMFAAGGRAYIYLCYGIHHLLNVVTNIEGIPEAVLIRAVEPLFETKAKATAGPGKLTKALGITTEMNDTSLIGNKLWLEDYRQNLDISSSKRIGIDYAGEDAALLWRFTAKDNPWVSR